MSSIDHMTAAEKTTALIARLVTRVTHQTANRLMPHARETHICE